jgi:ribosomal peptide maturation radical SAM protein 1
MPLASPAVPNLAIEQLAEIARRAGEPCETLHGSLLLPLRFPREMIASSAGPAAFTPEYYASDVEEVADAVVRCTVALRAGEVDAVEREALATSFLVGADAAAECLDRCMAAIPAGRYDVVGFSVGFDAQKLPSAALARRLKAREPRLRIVFGGTGCDEAMGPALLEVFPEVDAVVQGEAEHTFLPAVAALRGEQPLAAAPSVVHRDGERIVCNPEAPFPREMDDTPPPDYKAFVAEYRGSAYGRYPLTLLFETSRGCWWGEKHHCKFCGIRAVGGGYRRRSVRNATEQIERLSGEHAPFMLYSTDSIMDLGHLRELLPELARERRAGRLSSNFFYEIKSNARREQVALMAAAGVLSVQPGIESFSTRVLKLVDKGATALQQVELLKWARTYQVSLVYGLIVGVPGETAEDYESVLEMIPSLHHLPPPLSVNRLQLHRFSPYADDPARFGIRNVRPFDVHRVIYRASDEVLGRLCYDRAFDVEGADERADGLKARLRHAVKDWKSAYVERRVRFVESRAGDSVVLSRLRAGRPAEVVTLRGIRARIYAECAHVTTSAAIERSTGIPASEVEEVLEGFHERGWIVRDAQRWLALSVPEGADAWRDAGLDAAPCASAPREPVSPGLPVLRSGRPPLQEVPSCC